MAICIPLTCVHLEFVDNSPSLPKTWMPVFDPDPAKPWAEKLFPRDIPFAGNPLHLVPL